MGQKKVQNGDMQVRRSGLGPQGPLIQAGEAQEPTEAVFVADKPAKAFQSQNFRLFRVHRQAIVKGALRDNP